MGNGYGADPIYRGDAQRSDEAHRSVEEAVSANQMQHARSALVVRIPREEPRRMRNKIQAFNISAMEVLD